MQLIKIFTVILCLGSLAACSDIEIVSVDPITDDTCTNDSDCLSSVSCEIGVCNKSKGVCNYTVASTNCLIDSVCYNSGQEEPGAPCNICRPELEQYGFVKKLCDEGQTCDPADGQCVGSGQEACGDGILTESETCDDGNTTAGDGCSDACATEDGYACSEAGAACTDVDECAADTAPCDTNATCTNAPGTFSCACNDGFEGDGATCTDIDECAASESPCTTGETCTNTDGSFDCVCSDGYEADADSKCVDVDECVAETSPCAANEICTNTDGSFTCDPAPLVNITFSVDMSCSGLAEFTTVGISGPFSEWCGGCHPLTDEDGDNIWTGTFEFQLGEVVEYKYVTDNFAGQENLLDDMLGDGQCAPLTDYNGYANRQVVASEGLVLSETFGTCKTCDTVCESGFGVAVGGACADIDECAADVSPCTAPGTVCQNTSGSFECPCGSGFTTGEGGDCLDIDECSNVSYEIDQTFDAEAEGAVWKSDDGGAGPDWPVPVLLVEAGTLNLSTNDEGNSALIIGPAILQVDEGATIAFDIAFHQDLPGLIFDWWTCEDPAGSEACTKQVVEQEYGGPLTQTTLMTEKDIPPDDLGSGQIKHYEFVLPQNTPGFLLIFSVPAEAGKVWSLDNFQVFTQDNPCGAAGLCENTEGAYSCTCSAGYMLTEEGGCMDIDECATGETPCGDNATCTNTDGSYTCTCDKGYEGDGIVCCLIDNDGYSPCGPQTNVPLQTVLEGGWNECFKGPYSELLTPEALAACTQAKQMMLGCRQAGSDVIKLLAWAPTVDVMKDTGAPGKDAGQNTDVVTVSNGSQWYNGWNGVIGSMGFAKAGDEMEKNICDALTTGAQNQRLCWHISSPFGGFRCGESVWLNESAEFERIVFAR